jgi:hypothetical protein
MTLPSPILADPDPERRGSLPWQNVPAVVPNAPVVNTPEVVVMTGKPDVEPIAPAFVRLPWLCEVGVLASESLESEVTTTAYPPTENVPEMLSPAILA